MNFPSPSRYDADSPFVQSVYNDRYRRLSKFAATVKDDHDGQRGLWLLLATIFKNLVGEEAELLPNTKDKLVNCHGHAMGLAKWVCPRPCFPAWWPDGAPRGVTIHHWQKMLLTQGWEPCSPVYQRGVAKLAVFTDELIVSHSAKQLASGRWESKLGESVVLTNHSLRALEGGYGSFCQAFAKRR